MGRDSKIEWTTHTFNHVRGCTKVSEGCRNCYADTLSKRNPGTLGVWGPSGTRVVAAEAAWREPVKWNAAAAAAGERHRVFCASLADVFEDWSGPMSAASGERLFWPHNSWQDRRRWVGESECGGGEKPVSMDDVRRRLFDLIFDTPFLDWLLLTKRPQNISPTLDRLRAAGLVASDYFPWGNVWLGTSVENQQAADERIPHLLRVPAAVRFLSMEPLLGPVDLGPWLHRWDADGFAGPIDWVICGGESGPGARPMHPDWAKSLRDQCVEAETPFFFKQWGDWCPADVAPEPAAVPTTILAGSPAECTVMQKPSRKFQVVKPGGGDRVLRPDGRFTGEGPEAVDAWMLRVGKHDAGRLLDGQTWDGVPIPVIV